MPQTKYIVQEHEQRIKEFAVYQLVANGEVCKRIASCREKKDADTIAEILNERKV